MQWFYLARHHEERVCSKLLQSFIVVSPVSEPAHQLHVHTMCQHDLGLVSVRFQHLCELTRYDPLIVGILHLARGSGSLLSQID